MRNDCRQLVNNMRARQQPCLSLARADKLTRGEPPGVGRQFGGNQDVVSCLLTAWKIADEPSQELLTLSIQSASPCTNKPIAERPSDGQCRATAAEIEGTVCLSQLILGAVEAHARHPQTTLLTPRFVLHTHNLCMKATDAHRRGSS